MLESLRPSFTIARREVRDQFRDWRIIFPILGLTVVFPFIMNWTATMMLDFTEEYGATIIADRLTPFLLMVVGFFPISVSLVIALESFVGEKERGSIEPLLNTPLKDWQLYLGKLVSSTVPPLLSSFLGMAVYLTGLALNHIKIPDAETLIQVTLLTIVQAVMMVSGAVVVSSQATSVRAANLLSSFIVIPCAFLIQWEALVMFWGNDATLWWVVVGVALLAALLVRVGLAHFQREELLGREIDVLKIGWMARAFRDAFLGGATGLADWYRRLFTVTLARLKTPVLVTVGIAAAGVAVGLTQMQRFPLELDAQQIQNASGNLRQLLEIWPMFSLESLGAVWWQNVRVLLIAMVLGVFSFAIVGVMPLLVTMAVSGYLLGTLANSGFGLAAALALILPHGILEIPAAILATAAVLEAGAVLATPRDGQPIGEMWVIAVADWAKVMVGAVMPALLLAAAIEVWLTPRVAMLVF